MEGRGTEIIIIDVGWGGGDKNLFPHSRTGEERRCKRCLERSLISSAGDINVNNFDDEDDDQ